MIRRRGFTLGELVVLLCAVMLVWAVVTPAVARTRRRAAEASCANNLSVLWRLQLVRAHQFGTRGGRWPASTGKEFWLSLVRTDPPLVEAEEFDVFHCRVRVQTEGEPAPGVTHYLGPSRRVNTLRDDEAVGCDEASNHGPGGRLGGNVLRKSGDVIAADRVSFLEMGGQCSR